MEVATRGFRQTHVEPQKDVYRKEMMGWGAASEPHRKVPGARNRREDRAPGHGVAGHRSNAPGRIPPNSLLKQRPSLEEV